MVNNQKFEETFNQVNSQYASFFETKKVKVLEERKKALIIMLLIVGGFFLCMIIPFLLIFLFVGIFALIIYSAVNKKNSKNTNNQQKIYKVSEESSYTTQYKQLVVTPFIKLLTPNITYRSNKSMERRAYIDGQFEGFDRYTSDDDIVGYINNYQFELANVHTENEHTDSDGHTTYTTVFKGLYAFMPLPGTFEIEMFLRKDIKDTHKIFKKRGKGLEELYTKLDSSEFENKFDVYTNNKVFAAKILTHDIMQLMVDYVDKYHIPFEFTIKNNYFYIRFPGFDLFEPVIKQDKPALDKEVLYRDYSTLDFIYTVMYTMYDNISKNK